MKKWFLVLLLIGGGFFSIEVPALAQEKVIWDGAEIVKNQTGKMTFTKDVKVYKRDSLGNFVSLTVKRGNYFRVYNKEHYNNTTYLWMSGGYRVQLTDLVIYKEIPESERVANQVTMPKMATVQHISSLSLKQSPTPESKTLQFIPRNTPVILEEQPDVGYAKVQVEGLTGYVQVQYLQHVSYTPREVTQTVPLKKASSEQSETLKTISEKSIVLEVPIGNGWSYVVMNDLSGYIQTQMLDPLYYVHQFITTKKTLVKPSTSTSDYYDKLPEGTFVQEFMPNLWNDKTTYAFIRYGDNWGYVNRNDVTVRIPNTGSRHFKNVGEHGKFVLTGSALLYQNVKNDLVMYAAPGQFVKRVFTPGETVYVYPATIGNYTLISKSSVFGYVETSSLYDLDVQVVGPFSPPVNANITFQTFNSDSNSLQSYPLTYDGDRWHLRYDPSAISEENVSFSYTKTISALSINIRQPTVQDETLSIALPLKLGSKSTDGQWQVYAIYKTFDTPAGQLKNVVHLKNNKTGMQIFIASSYGVIKLETKEGVSTFMKTFIK